MPKKTPVIIQLSIVAALVWLVGWSLFQKPWIGIGEDGQEVGLYRTLLGCRTVIEKTGGWCGEDCIVYSGREIAHCKPLVKIAKRRTE